MEVKIIDYQSDSAPRQFALALKEIGFAVITNHPISSRLIDDSYVAWKKFFDSEEKNQYLFDSEKHDGFVPFDLSETAKGHSLKDLKEFFHFYPWGRCPDWLRPITMQMYAALNTLAETLLQWVEVNAPTEIRDQFSMPLNEMIRDSQRTLFRPIHYPPLTGKEQAGAIRAAAHEDINLLTMLPAATAKGLQVKDVNGHWLDVPINPGWIIVNTGDMLQECSNHYYPSTTHRVINPEGETAKQSRLSMPLFLHPRDEVRLSSRYTAASYRHERYAEIGLD